VTNSDLESSVTGKVMPEM